MLTSDLIKEFLRLSDGLKSKNDFDNLSKEEQEYVKSVAAKMDSAIAETENKLKISSEENDLE